MDLQETDGHASALKIDQAEREARLQLDRLTFARAHLKARSAAYDAAWDALCALDEDRAQKVWRVEFDLRNGR